MHTDAQQGEIVFVRLGPEHAPAMCHLEQLCFTLPWDKAQIEQAFLQKAFLAFGLCRQDTLIAYISLYNLEDTLEVLNIAVQPQERCKGHGKKLLGLVLRIAGKLGILEVILEVRPGNTAAIALYKGLGFTHVGTRPAYYADTGEDAHVYRNTLPSAI